jgi:adenylyltransferase/sulfurtransferase
VQLRHRQLAGGVDLDALAARLRKQGAVSSNEFMLRTEITDNDQPYELTLFHDGRAIIKGTNDAGVARSIYAKYIGS